MKIHTLLRPERYRITRYHFPIFAAGDKEYNLTVKSGTAHIDRRAMKCEYHPDADAIEGCIRCQRLICAQCRVVIDGNVYCRQCLNELNKQTDRAGCARVYLVDTSANTAELSGHQKCRYHEHENVLAVCAQCGSAICGQCCHERGGKILCGHCLKLSTPSKSHSGLGNTILILVLIVLVSSGIMAYRIVQQHHDKPQTPDYGAFAQSTFVDVQPPVLKVTGVQVKLTNNSGLLTLLLPNWRNFLNRT
jgi:hypothetical protein